MLWLLLRVVMMVVQLDWRRMLRVGLVGGRRLPWLPQMLQVVLVTVTLERIVAVEVEVLLLMLQLLVVLMMLLVSVRVGGALQIAQVLVEQVIVHAEELHVHGCACVGGSVANP